MNHRSQQEPQPDDSQHWRRPMDSELGSLLFFFFDDDKTQIHLDHVREAEAPPH